MARWGYHHVKIRIPELLWSGCFRCALQCLNKAIRDGRPRPPRHQVGWDIVRRGHFDTNPESLRPFVPEIWPNNVFNLSATYDLDLWPKILKIFVSHGVPIRNMYAKFHNDRLRDDWDITLCNFAKTRTNTQTDMGITIPRPPPMGGEVIMDHLHCLEGLPSLMYVLLWTEV